MALAPRPQVPVPAAGCGAADVLEGAGLLVDIGEVHEHLHDVLVLRVAVPALRRDPVACLG
jgi:hypothetical protein